MEAYKMDTVHLEKFNKCSTTPTTSIAAIPTPRQLGTSEVVLPVRTKQDPAANTQPIKGEQEVEEKITMIKKEIETLSSTLPSGNDQKQHDTTSNTSNLNEMTTEELENEAKELRRQELIEQVKQLRVSLFLSILM